jgi:beta-lactam-binding protein with PASTA domain
MKIVRLLLSILAAAAVFFLSTLVTITMLIKDTDSVNCPETVGKDIQEARRIAEGNGLSVVVVRYEKRKDIPFNEVISQRPEANMSVRRGRTVSVVVSEGPLPVTVPDVVNHPLEMAQAILQEKSIKIKNVVYVPSDKEGRVVAQSPRTGPQILDEEGMVLFVGEKAKSFYILSEVAGVNYGRLVREFDTNHLEYRLNFTHRPDQPAKSVLDASVPLRTIFDSNQVIQLTVNLGG